MDDREHFVLRLTDLYQSIYATKRKTLRYYPNDGEDILQEAYARALEFWYTAPSDDEELKAWFNHIVKQCISYFLNFYKYRGTSSNNQNNLGYITVKFTEFNDRHSKEVQEDEGEIHIYKNILYDMLMKENPKHRPILICNLVHGLDPEDIMKITMLSKKNVNMILYRFRKKLKETLNDEMPEVQE